MSGDKDCVRVVKFIRAASRQVLDFALPPRCAGYGTVVADLHSFCPERWMRLEFLADAGSSTCGTPLEAAEAETYGVCIAKPPRIARTRAAVAYDELSLSIALRLKYGRKVALARTMARDMAPVVERVCDPILMPVPLHPSRLWTRGLDQSALVARELSKATGFSADSFLLKRVTRTPALKVLSLRKRRKLVAGAFKVDPKSELQGRTVVLVDDVLTTGSTANACARALPQAGAGRVDLVSWARAMKPVQLI